MIVPGWMVVLGSPVRLVVLVLGCVVTGLIGLVCTCRQPTPPFPKRHTVKTRTGSIGDEVPKPILSSISTGSLYEALRLALLTDEGASFDQYQTMPSYKGV